MLKDEIDKILASLSARISSLLISPFVWVVVFGQVVPMIIFDYLIAVFLGHLINPASGGTPIHFLKKKIYERKYSLINIVVWLAFPALKWQFELSGITVSLIFASLYLDRYGFSLYGTKNRTSETRMHEDSVSAHMPDGLHAGGAKDPKILLYNLGIMMLIALIAAAFTFFIGIQFMDDLCRFQGYTFPPYLKDFPFFVIGGFVGMLLISCLRPPFGFSRLSKRKINPFAYSLVFFLIFFILGIGSIGSFAKIDFESRNHIAAKLKHLQPPKIGFAAVGLNSEEYEFLNKEFFWPYPKLFFNGQAEEISVECLLPPDEIGQRFILNYRLPFQLRVDSFRFMKDGNLYVQTYRDSNSFKYVRFETEFATQTANKSVLAEDEVMIFHKVFMRYNLAVDRFRNGDTLFQARTPEQWKYAAEKQIPAWCYPNVEKLYLDHGVLYNAYAVTDPRGLAPEGWRIPDNDELDFVKNYKEVDDLNDEDDDHLRNKQFWYSGKLRNGFQTNGWKAYPVNMRYATGGWRTFSGETYLDHSFAAWWCIAPNSPQHPSGLILPGNFNKQRAEISDTINPGAGLSVRCVKE